MTLFGVLEDRWKKLLPPCRKNYS